MRLSKSLLLLSLLVLTYILHAQPNEAPERTDYIYSSFKKGTVLFKDNRQQEAFLNYNSDKAQIAYKNNEKEMIVTNAQEIDTVFIEGQKFIPLNGQFFELEHVYATTTLLSKYKNNYKPMQEVPQHSGTETAASENSSNTIAADGLARKFKSNYRTVFYKVYYLKQNDLETVRPIQNEKQLLKAFPER